MPEAEILRANPDVERYVRNLSIVLTRHIIPLFYRHRGKPDLTGAGTLVSSKKAHYLITAAHVIDPIKSGEELFFYVDKNMTQKLAGRAILSRPPNRADICVIQIQGPLLPPFEKVDKFPLSVDMLLPHAVPRDRKQYLLVGFPASKSKSNRTRKTINSVPYSFRNMGAAESKYSALGLDPRFHILLAFDQDRIIVSEGEFRSFPSPKGMSGSPLWLLYDAVHPNDPLTTPMVGVAVEHRTLEKVIVATDISFALELINDFEA
jgi:hypothetical protein